MYNTFIQDPIQIEYVNKKLSNHNLLLGAAGTGKTTIAMAKLYKILTEGASSNTLFVSYTNTLVNSCEQESLINAAKTTNLFPVSVDFKTFHKLFFELYRSVYNTYPKVLSGREMTNAIRRAIQICKINEPTNEIFNKSDELFEDEFKYIQGFNINSLAEYEKATRIGCKIKLIRRIDRKYYWKVYEEYKNIMTNALQKTCDFPGAASIFYDLVKKHFPNGIYDTIIIDEGQDLSPADVKTILAMLRKNGVLLYIGDSTQQIYGSRMSWKSLGLNIKNKVTRLENSYRNTVEIGNFVIDILNSSYWDKNTNEIMYPKNMKKHGIKPLLIQFDTKNEQLYTIKQFLKKYSNETTCIVAYKNKIATDIINMFRDEKINIENVKEYKSNSKIKTYVCTYHSIKGLEFDNVILWDLDANFINNINKSEEDIEVKQGQAARLFYVACTRARKRLIISSVDMVSDIFPLESKNYQQVDVFSFLNVCDSDFKNDNEKSMPVSITQSMATSVLVNKEEMLDYLQKALKETRTELDIQSPWITERVVDPIFIDKLERLLSNNVTVKILYGIQDDPNIKHKNTSTDIIVDKLQSRFKSYPNFKIKRGNSHAKKLICDMSFCISGSLNWLSYTGQGERAEEGVLLTAPESICIARKETFNF